MNYDIVQMATAEPGWRAIFCQPNEGERVVPQCKVVACERRHMTLDVIAWVVVRDQEEGITDFDVVVIPPSGGKPWTAEDVSESYGVGPVRLVGPGAEAW